MPSREVDKDPKKFWSHWNLETKQVILVGDKHTLFTDRFINFHFQFENFVSFKNSVDKFLIQCNMKQ